MKYRSKANEGIGRIVDEYEIDQGETTFYTFKTPTLSLAFASPPRQQVASSIDCDTSQALNRTIKDPCKRSPKAKRLVIEKLEKPRTQRITKKRFAECLRMIII